MQVIKGFFTGIKERLVGPAVTIVVPTELPPPKPYSIYLFTCKDPDTSKEFLHLRVFATNQAPATTICSHNRESELAKDIEPITRKAVGIYKMTSMMGAPQPPVEMPPEAEWNLLGSYEDE